MHPAAPSLSEFDRPALLAALRARLARHGGATLGAATVPLCPAIDQALPGGGLARATLHEVLAGEPGAAAGFCALALARAARAGQAPAGSVVWIAPAAAEWPTGLGRFGLAPADLVLVQAPRPEDALWAMEESLRCPGIAGALLAMGKAGDPAMLHRLQLAAGAGGALGLVLRPDDPVEPGSALDSRWRVEALAGAGATLGDPRWRLELLRGRAGRAGQWKVCWRSAADRLDIEEEAETPVVRPRPDRATRPRG